MLFTDWRKIAGFRDVLTHVYFGIKPTTLWDIAKTGLPGLKKEIRLIIRDEMKKVESDDVIQGRTVICHLTP